MTKKLTSTFKKELQAAKGIAYPTEILATNGELQKIEFHDVDGNFIIEALWDPNDKQTSEYHDLFRKWAYSIMKDKGYKVILSDTKLGVVR